MSDTTNENQISDKSNKNKSTVSMTITNILLTILIILTGVSIYFGKTFINNMQNDTENKVIPTVQIHEQVKEVTICFSKSDCSNRYATGSVGDGVGLCSGKCDGKTLDEMYEDNWHLIETIGGLQSAFGFVLEREIQK